MSEEGRSMTEPTERQVEAGRIPVWVCDNCGDLAEVDPGDECEVCCEGTIQVVEYVPASYLRADPPKLTGDDIFPLSDLSGRLGEIVGDVAAGRRQAVGIMRHGKLTGVLLVSLDALAPYLRADPPGGGLELTEELRSRLPEPRYEEGVGWMRGTIDIGLGDDGSWEIEWCPLDQHRNVFLRRSTLKEALEAVLAHDDDALSARDRGGER